MTAQKIRIGTRGSALARVQTDTVAASLRATDPSLDIEVIIIETKGDIDQRPIPLDTVGKGWFTEEIEASLTAGTIDLAVHSLKDLADEMPEGLYLGAYLPREDARDVLITQGNVSLQELPSGSVIGTDSARRRVQLLALRPDLRVESMRGNVPTRIQKLDDGVCDGIVLAAAGLKRLGLQDRVTQYFEIDEMVPSPGQGILAIQANEANAQIKALLAQINDTDTAVLVQTERSFSRAIGGGCKAPTGAYATHEGNECVLVGMLESSGKILRSEKRAPWSESNTLGEDLAREMLAMRG